MKLFSRRSKQPESLFDLQPRDYAQPAEFSVKLSRARGISEADMVMDVVRQAHLPAISFEEAVQIAHKLELDQLRNRKAELHVGLEILSELGWTYHAKQTTQAEADRAAARAAQGL